MRRLRRFCSLRSLAWGDSAEGAWSGSIASGVIVRLLSSNESALDLISPVEKTCIAWRKQPHFLPLNEGGAAQVMAQAEGLE